MDLKPFLVATILQAIGIIDSKVLGLYARVVLITR